MVRIPGHVLPALARAKRLAPSPGESNQNLSLTVVLKPDDVAGFENYLREVYDPDSQNFHHFLVAQEIDARFGPSEKSYQSLQEYLTAHNLKLAQGASDYQTITVTGTRADVESAFELTIGDYQIGARKFYANRTDPALPAQLAAHVMAVIGLNDLAEPMHSDQSHPWLSLAPSIGDGFNIAIAAIAGTVAVLGLPFEIALMIFLATIIFIMGLFVLLGGLDGATVGPSGIRASAIPDATPPGSGQTVGLVEFDTFQTSDVSDYLDLLMELISLLGVPPGDIGNLNNLSVVPVDGGASPGPSQSEVLLDIDDVMTAAPGAKVAVYDAPFSGGGSFQSVLNAMISGGVNVISNSWAYCEDQTTLADVQSIDSLMQKAAVAGITVLSGAGDSGSTCLDGSPNTVAVPADSPNLTAVGGSSLTVGPGLTYGNET